MSTQPTRSDDGDDHKDSDVADLPAQQVAAQLALDPLHAQYAAAEEQTAAAAAAAAQKGVMDTLAALKRSFAHRRSLGRKQNFDSSLQTAADETINRKELLFQERDHLYEPNSPDLIGAGGFGEVYRARWTPSAKNAAYFERLGSPPVVAVKAIRIQDSVIRGDFLRDVAALNEQNNRPKGSLRLFGAGGQNDVAYVVMEYMPHGDLAHFVQSQHWRDMTMDQRWELLRQMVRSVDVLHRENIMHRNIKSGNFLVHNAGSATSPQWCIKACDLNLSAALWALTASSRIRDHTGLDTAPFTAPEWLSYKCMQYHSSMDVFSLGMTIWSLLNEGKSPWPRAIHLWEPLLKMCDSGARPSFDRGIAEMSPLWRLHAVRLISACWDQDWRNRPTCAQVMVWMEGAPAQVDPAAVVQKALECTSVGWSATTPLMDEILSGQPPFTSEQVHQLLALFLYDHKAADASTYAQRWGLPHIDPSTRNYWIDSDLTVGNPSCMQLFFEIYYHYITDEQLGQRFATERAASSHMRGKTRVPPGHLTQQMPFPAHEPSTAELPPSSKHKR